MGIFRQLAHLEEQIGQERFRILVSPEHTGKIRAFCDGILDTVSPLPAEMVIGGRTYEILAPACRQKDGLVSGRAMLAWSKNQRADLGVEDCDHVIRYQLEIPVVFRDRVHFEFTDMMRGEEVAVVAWSGSMWYQGWSDICYGRDRCARVLRRKS